MDVSKPINIQLDDIHVAVLEATVDKLKEKGVKTNKTDVIQKAIYNFGNDLLNNKEMKAIIDKHYKGFGIDWIE